MHNIRKSDIILDHLNQSSLTNLLDTPLLDNDFRVNIIEEKSEVYEGAQLSRFVPQVSGEGLVV